MKELAEQAATGTYDSTQRLMIESEYQAMASEITRIANATDINGIKLLDGSLSGRHDGSGIKATGQMKIHFGSGNDRAEDYYYISIGDCTAATLGIGNQSAVIKQNVEYVYYDKDGNKLEEEQGYVDLKGNPYTPVIREEGIHPVYTDGTVDGATGNLLTISEYPKPGEYASTEYGWQHTPQGPLTPYMVVDSKGNKVQAYADDAGSVPLKMLVWDPIFKDANGNVVDPDDVRREEVPTGDVDISYPDAYTISTQEAAQRALVGLNNAIVLKDNIRAHLGALQNRLENTVSNLNIQAENLQVAESRISDVDVATEMTQFVRNQILTQSAVAMLSQANSMPQMVTQLIG